MTLLNHYSYLLLAVAVVALFALWLWRRRIGTVPLRLLFVFGVIVLFAAPPIVFARSPTPVEDIAELRQLVSSGQPTLVEYYSPYCLGCLSTRPIAEAVGGSMGPEVRVIHLDATDPVAGAIGRELGFQITPSYALYDGIQPEPVWRLPGPLDRQAIGDQLRRLADDG